MIVRVILALFSRSCSMSSSGFANPSWHRRLPNSLQHLKPLPTFSQSWLLLQIEGNSSNFASLSLGHISSSSLTTAFMRFVIVAFSFSGFVMSSSSMFCLLGVREKGICWVDDLLSVGGSARNERKSSQKFNGNDHGDDQLVASRECLLCVTAIGIISSLKRTRNHGRLLNKFKGELSRITMRFE